MVTATQQMPIAEIEPPRIRPVTRLDGNAKSRAILDAAARLFLVQGFGATSMHAVAAAAGMSKRTLYIHFRTKHALFAAVIQTLCARIASPSLDELDTLRVEDGLENLGCQVLSGLCSAEQIELFRTVATDVRRFPELGVVLLDGPMRRIEDLFAEYFRAQVEARKLVLRSPRRRPVPGPAQGRSSPEAVDEAGQRRHGRGDPGECESRRRSLPERRAPAMRRRVPAG